MNKKAILGMNLALTAAVIVLFVMHFTSGSKPEGTSEMMEAVEPNQTEDKLDPLVVDSTDEALPEFNRGLKIAFVNSDTVSKKYKYYEDAAKEFDRELSKLKGSLEQKERSFTTKVEKFQRKVQEGEMWQDQIDAEAAKLEEERYDLQMKQAEYQQRLAKKQEELYSQVLNRTTKYLNRIGEELGYDYVLTYSQSPSLVVYANSEFDITDYVIRKLNEAYEAGKQAE